MKGTDLAPEGAVFVCEACGKTSRTRYGFTSAGPAHTSSFLPDGTRVADRGWDESCMLNAVLCDRAFPDVLFSTLKDIRGTVWNAIEPQPFFE